MKVDGKCSNSHASSTHEDIPQGGESRDFKRTTMADTCENTVDSGKTFFDISVHTG